MKVTITFEIDSTTLSEDARENHFEGFHCLLDNVVRDGMEHAEPKTKLENVRILIEDK
jgi:hypothetical protein